MSPLESARKLDEMEHALNVPSLFTPPYPPTDNGECSVLVAAKPVTISDGTELPYGYLLPFSWPGLTRSRQG